MSDDFERQLSVALKTAARNLDADAPPTAARVPSPSRNPGTSRHRGPTRMLLATGVVVLLAVVVAGSWWAVGRPDHRSAVPAAELSPCVATDLRATLVTDPSDASYRGFEVGSVSSTCQLEVAPVVTAAGHSVPYLDPATGAGMSAAPSLPVVVGDGRSAEFAVVAGKDAAAYACYRTTGPLSHGAVDVVLDSAVALSFDVAGGPPCQFEHEVLVLRGTSVGWSTSGPTDCTAEDLTVTWRPGLGTPPRGTIELVDAAGRCVVREQPEVVVDGHAVPYASVSGPLTWEPTLVMSSHPLDEFVNVYTVNGCSSSAAAATPRPGQMSIGGTGVVSFTLTLDSCDATAVAFGPRPDAPDLTPGQN